MKNSILLACCLLGGCATGPFEWRYGHDKIVPGQFSMTNTDKNGTVLTWPSHAVAAVVYPNGDAICIQSAQSAKARNASGAGNLSASLPTGEKVGVALANVINEAVASLQDRNDVATFLDVALFQICTIARNKNIDSATTVTLIDRALQASETIAKARPKTQTVGNTIIPSGTIAVVAEQKKDVAVVQP